MSTILVVDDEEANRALIHAYLADSGLVIVDASSGVAALELVERLSPDLVLLDVLMPGMDGFEVARQLKATRRDVFLPIILVTALTDQNSRREGLLAGADDFLSKPVDPQELTVRVRNLLSLREKERALLEKNVELAELDRFKQEVSALLVHDMKSPLSASLLCIKHTLETCRCQGDAHDALESAYQANLRLLAMITDLLEVERLEAARLVVAPSTFDLQPWCATILEARRWEASERNILLENRLAPESIVQCDAVLLARVMDNLIGNALRYTPAGGRLVIEGSRQHDDIFQLRVGNTGRPIRPSWRSTVFEKYARADRAVERLNHGLGLYFCRLAVEAQGGQISIDESPELPTVFVVHLPAPDSSMADSNHAHMTEATE